MLQGAVDLHVHGAPDIVPRKGTVLEMARQARAAGMRGIVFKNHYTSTVDQAALVAEMVPGVRVMGGLVLNHSACGGLNPGAVEVALRMGARVIWMPTISAANHHAKKVAGRHARAMTEPEGDRRPPISVLDAEGRLLPEVHDIMDLVGQAGALLATGHLSPAEVWAVVRAAPEHGVEKLLVNHVEHPLVDMPQGDQVELCRRGVFMERCFLSTLHGVKIEAIAAMIRAAGVGTTVLATDLGQAANDAPVQGLEVYMRLLGRHGFTEAEVERMVCANPAALVNMS